MFVEIFFILSLGLELLKVAIENAGYTGKIKIGMDVAASGMIEQNFSNVLAAAEMLSHVRSAVFF